MPAPTRGGRGSNQYMTRPGSPTTSARSSSRDLSAAAAADPEEVAWAFNPDRAAWSAVGLDSLSEARPWMDAAVPPREVPEWRGRGFSASTAGEWQAAGFDDPGDAKRWVDEGVTDPVAADAWLSDRFDHQLAGIAVKHGFTPTEAHEWWDALQHFDEFDDRDLMFESARRWANMGIEPLEAQQRFENRDRG